MNNTNFDSFYFLHIKRTAGRFFTNNIADNIKGNFPDAGIRYLNNTSNGNNHLQWSNDINQFTYVSTVLREPCEHAVSLYLHSFSSDSPDHIDSLLKSKLNKKDFLQWFDKAQPFIKNYQSKNIIFPTLKNDKDDFCEVFQKNNLVTKEEVLKKIDKISLLLRSSSLIQQNIKSIQEKILFDLNIKNANVTNTYFDRKTYKNTYSDQIYAELSTSEKDYIRSVNNIDADIYSTENLFWNM